MIPPAVKKGDVVVRRNSDKLMTVKDVDNETHTVLVQWFNKKLVLEDYFPAEELTVLKT